MTVEHYCQTEVETVAHDTPVGDAALRMQEQGIGCLVVLDADGRPTGIVTDRDLAMRVVAERRKPAETLIGQVMSSPLISVEPHDSIDSALQLMADHGVRRAPVVAGGWCNGIVVLDDVLLELAHELQDLALGVRGRVRRSRRKAHMETFASHVEERFSDVLSWMGEQGRNARQSAEKLVREIREVARGDKH